MATTVRKRLDIIWKTIVSAAMMIAEVSNSLYCTTTFGNVNRDANITPRMMSQRAAYMIRLTGLIASASGAVVLLTSRTFIEFLSPII